MLFHEVQVAHLVAATLEWHLLLKTLKSENHTGDKYLSFGQIQRPMKVHAEGTQSIEMTEFEQRLQRNKDIQGSA